MSNKKLILKRYVALIVSIIMVLSTCMTVSATETQSQLEKEISTLQSEINAISSELVELTEEQALIEEKIMRTQDEMVKTQIALEESRVKEVEQYDSMKLRIRYMYEEGQTSLLEILFGAESLVDFINKSEFVNNVTEYDKNMLNTLAEISKQIEFEEENLIAQEQALLVLEENNNAIKEELEAKAKASSTDLSSVQAKLTALKKAEAEAQAQAEAEAEAEKDNATSGNTSGGTTTGPSYEADASETDVLAAILDCEAISNYNAMLAVATVIMNRVSDSRFSNTVTGVIYQSGQFSPTWTGKLDRVLASGASSLAYRVAQDALAGARYSAVSHCYYFLSAASTSKNGVNVGGNIFFASW